MTRKKTDDLLSDEPDALAADVAESEPAPEPPPVEPPPPDPEYFVWHEDGHKIEVSRDEIVRDGDRFNPRQVADLGGRLYHHVGEVDGHWTYREE